MIAAAVTLIPIGTASVALASPASAAIPQITCKAMTGTVNPTTHKVVTHLSKCNGNTGGGGSSTGSETATSATVKWKNGKSTSFTVAQGAPTKPCPTGDTPSSVSGKVTADTTGSAGVGGTVSENVCFNPNTLTISLATGTVAKI
jgi:hypothetical protein